MVNASGRKTPSTLYPTLIPRWPHAGPTLFRISTVRFSGICYARFSYEFQGCFFSPTAEQGSYYYGILPQDFLIPWKSPQRRISIPWKRLKRRISIPWKVSNAEFWYRGFFNEREAFLTERGMNASSFKVRTYTFNRILQYPYLFVASNNKLKWTPSIRSIIQ